MTRNSDIPNLSVLAWLASKPTLMQLDLEHKWAKLVFYCQYTCLMTYPVTWENERPKSCQLYFLPTRACWNTVALSLAKLCKKKLIEDIIGFWIPRRGFRYLGAGFQSLSVGQGFYIQSIASGTSYSSNCIPDSKARDFGSHVQNFPDPRISWSSESGFPYIER